MKTIYKYPFKMVNEIIQMPKGAEIKHVAIQGQNICLWAQVDSENEPEERHFVVYGTGWKIYDGEIYLGTVHTKDGLVWHVYEVVR